jgi:hypothetical protein
MSETPLQMVHRHLSEGERHIAQQLLLIERLRSQQSTLESQDLLAEAEALLDQFKSTQASHTAHLYQIREDQNAGLRDADGNLNL